MRYMPNPVKSILDVTLDNDYLGNVSVIFRSVDGRVIRSMNYVKQQTIFNMKMNLEDLPSGIYFIEVGSGRYSQTSKIVKM